jgi:hypothetical protein
MEIIKTRATNILCLRSSIVCNKNLKKNRKLKNHEKVEKVRKDQKLT